jgi:nicotinamidase-related amidase
MQSRRVDPDKAVLIVIDIQEKLLPAMFEKERLVQNTLRLIKGAQILKRPVIVTEQYPQGLGPTVEEISGVVPAFSPIAKMAFSACGAESVRAALKNSGASEILLCGIECHVCVSQTCLDLLDDGFRVFAVADATASRTAANHQAGIDRMLQAGAIIVSTEMILFELLQRAGTEYFKEILALVK